MTEDKTMDSKAMLERASALKKRRDALAAKKAELLGQGRAGEERLKKLVEEITARGYDPKKLPAERAAVAAAINGKLDVLEQDLNEAEELLRKMEERG